MIRSWAAIAAALVAMFAFVGCSQTGTTFQNNTGAQITVLSPSKVQAGSSDLTLTVTSTGGFVPKTVIQLNGKTLAGTTVVDATTATVVIPASDLAKPGKAFVNTLNPPRNSQDNGLSNSLAFIVYGAPNAVPTIKDKGVSPATATNCAAACTNSDTPITIVGTNFLATSSNGPSEVHWSLNGGPVVFLPIQTITPTQISATIPGILLSTPGTAQITVVNPPSFPCSVDCGVFGGGPSNPASLTVQ
jgi:hypothetical protein